MRHLLLLPLLVLAFACSSTSDAVLAGSTGSAQEASTQDYDVTIVQQVIPEVFRGDSSAEMKFQITVKNHSSIPLDLSRITLQSLGSNRLYIPVRSREFEKTIAPGAEESFTFWATVYVTEQTTRGPLTLRATIEGLAGGTEREEVFTQRVGGHGLVGASWDNRRVSGGPALRQQKWSYDQTFNTMDYGAYGLPW